MEYINKLLHRAAAIPARTSPSPTPPSDNDNTASKNAEHEVKVQFAREFADVGSITCPAPDSLSSTSSFQSIASTLSTKSTSGDFVPNSPAQAFDNSYADPNISGLNDLILGCAKIRLNSDDDPSFDTLQNSLDFSQDQTFASATDTSPADFPLDIPPSEHLPRDSQNVTQIIEDNSATCDSTCSTVNYTENDQESPTVGTVCIKEPLPIAVLTSNRRNSFIRLEGLGERSNCSKESKDLANSDCQTNSSLVDDAEEVLLPPPRSVEESNLHSPAYLSPCKETLNVSNEEGSSVLNNSSTEVRSLSLSFVPSTTVNSVSNSESVFAEHAEIPSLPSIPTFSSLLNNTDSIQKLNESDVHEITDNVNDSQTRSTPSLDNCNEVATSFSQIVDKSSVQEAQDKSSSLVEEVSSHPSNNIVNDEKIRLNDTLITRPKTPEVQENSSANICQAIEAPIATPKTPEVQENIFQLIKFVIARSKTPEIQEISATSACQAIETPIVRPTTPEIQEKLVTNICQANETSIARPTTPEVQENLVTSICQLNETPVARPKTPEIHEDSVTSIHQTVDIPVVRPKTPEIRENSITSVYQTIDTCAARSKTPELHENSASNTFQEIKYSNNVSSNILELSPSKETSLEINGTASKEEELETTKLNESPSKKSADDLDSTRTIDSIKNEENEEFNERKLDTTVTLQDEDFLTSKNVSEAEQYTDFKPQRQSTSLATLNIEHPNFEELKAAAKQVANDIFNSSLELPEDDFVSATSDIFQDPKSFDFLINYGNSKTINRLRTESLYVKFDPLVGEGTSMLPQANAQPINEEQNGKSENVPANVVTPKRNPAIAAIDRLLFYSPICTSMTQKTEEPEEKMASKEQLVEEPKSDTPLITDVNMSRELELVRTTVLQLEEELEKQKKEYEAELDKQKNAYQEKINKLQAQIAQEVKSKSQMTVVVEEYEKSISRLLTERERDRTNFEQEKAKIQEELQATNVHLTNTEAAFNDVHQKYEKLKAVVSAYKSNETVLKESIQENMDTIKGLETRYDQLKNHAMVQLEKANFELDAIRKQHEDETVKLHAMVRKAELKSNSLAELVEQKTKENKELTQILDEVIARVGHHNSD
ncbi:transforming acidic coiled-coil protein isoform X2 [Xylocopa sonorina]|uniref:transforming acidic coiled-coil protein isoform X2 n=1 Tax=Xylocopa sonorina TaxID=1818115 RepID=UPI00403B1F5C